MGRKSKISVAINDGEFKQLRPDSVIGKALMGNDDDEDKTTEIKGATLKDDFCNYDYEFIRGVGTGDSVSRKGSNIVHNDLKDAFKKLHPHLAVICEEIELSELNGYDIENIAEYDHDTHIQQSVEYKVSNFSVSAFKITSTGENESVVLVGSKKLSTGDFVELKSPKTNWQGEYHFVNELRAAIDDCRAEVEAYMNGKAAPKYVQGSLDIPENEEGSDVD